MAGFPIQGGEGIPDWLARLAYKEYVRQYGNQQSFERIKERGGFGRAEVVLLLKQSSVKTEKDVKDILNG